MTDTTKLLAKLDAALARRVVSAQRKAASGPEELAKLKTLRISVQKRVEELERAHTAAVSAAARTEAEYARLANLRDRASVVMAQRPPPAATPPERAVEALKDAPHLLRELRAASRDVEVKDWISGIYFLFDGEDVIYVGQSVNVVGRVTQHAVERLKTFQRWAYVAATREELNELERFYIALLCPRDNVSFKPKEAA